MKKLLLLFALIVCSYVPVRAQGVPVVDYMHIISDTVSWIENAASWATDQTAQYQQVYAQYEQIANQVLELQRLGDPSQLVGTLGLNNLKRNTTEFLTSYESLRTDVDGAYALTRSQIDTYKDIDLEDFRQAALIGKITDEYSTKSKANVETRQRIDEEIKDTLSDLNSASDEATANRLAAKLQVLAAQQAAVNASDAAAAAASTVATNDMQATNQAKRQAAADAMDKAYDEAMKSNMEMDYTPYKNMSVDAIFKNK